jgi:hypothetical protein
MTSSAYQTGDHFFKIAFHVREQCCCGAATFFHAVVGAANYGCILKKLILH